MNQLRTQELRGMLRTRDQLRLSGESDGLRARTKHDVARLIAQGVYSPVRRGRYVRATEWNDLFAEERHLLRVLATADAATEPGPVFSHYSAAALHGLPLYRMGGARAYTVSPRSIGRSNGEVVRRVAPLSAEDICEFEGLRYTTLERTVIDVCRIASPELSVACADAALRRVADSGEPWQAWVRDAFERVGARPGTRGSAQARRILSLADPSADSVLESVSRLYLLQLGFDVRTQVPVPGPSGQTYRVDFEFVGCGVLGEVDGRVKYTQSAMTRGSSAAEIVLKEKEREDWIRGHTGMRVIRWGASDLRSLESFAQRLAGFSVALPIGRASGR